VHAQRPRQLSFREGDGTQPVTPTSVKTPPHSTRTSTSKCPLKYSNLKLHMSKSHLLIFCHLAVMIPRVIVQDQFKF